MGLLGRRSHFGVMEAGPVLALVYTSPQMSQQLQDTSQHPQRKAGWGGKRAYLESDYQGPCWVTLGSTFPLPTPVPACKIQNGVT